MTDQHEPVLTSFLDDQDIHVVCTLCGWSRHLGPGPSIETATDAWEEHAQHP